MNIYSGQFFLNAKIISSRWNLQRLSPHSNEFIYKGSTFTYCYANIFSKPQNTNHLPFEFAGCFFSFTNNFKSSSTFLNSCSIFIIVLQTIYAFTFFEVDSDKLFHGAISFRPLHKLHFVLFKSWNNLKIKIKCEIIWNLFYLDRNSHVMNYWSNFQRQTGFCFGEKYSTETFGE